MAVVVVVVMFNNAYYSLTHAVPVVLPPCAPGPSSEWPTSGRKLPNMVESGPLGQEICGILRPAGEY